jgi:hypothetical protein
MCIKCINPSDNSHDTKHLTDKTKPAMPLLAFLIAHGSSEIELKNTNYF